MVNLHQLLFCISLYLVTNKALGEEHGHSEGNKLVRYQVPDIILMYASNPATTILRNTGLQALLRSWTRQQ
jgi:hypothetical protein